MSLHLLRNNPDGSRIAIWEITENVAELFSLADVSEKMRSEVESFRSETRKKEWFTLRILLKNILKVAQPDEIIYDETGKPHLKNGNGHISFSHAKNFAAIIFHPDKSAGIDIETLRERIENISHKFVNEEESSFIKKEKRFESLHIIWGVKEVLFKIYGKGGLDFKKQMVVHSFVPAEEGRVEAELKTDNRTSSFRINYFFKKGIILVYGTST